MKETYTITNNLQTEFASSRLIRMFNGFNETNNKRIKITDQSKYFDTTSPKYTKSTISKKLLEFLSNEDWSHSGNKTSFNTIQLLEKYGIVKRFYSKDPSKKHKAYLKLVNNNKFYIRNQDQFHYAVVSELHGWFEKQGRQDILSDFFYYNDGYPFVNEDKITIEETEKTSGGILRTDMAFYVGKYKIIVEYLESQHDQDKLLGHEYDRVRALRLIGDTQNKSYEIAHIAFFWQKNLYSRDKKRFSFNTREFSNFIEHVGQVILDYYLISDEDGYCINKLTQITGNKSLSEQIYLAHNNQNKPVINLTTLEKLFNWAKPPKTKMKTEKMWYAEFADRAKQMQSELLAQKHKDKKNMSIFDSDSDSDSDTNYEIESDTNTSTSTSKIKIPDDEIIYYEIKDDDIYLTHFGLHVYIDMGPKYLANMIEYFKIRKFYNNISSGLIESIKEIRFLIDNRQKNQIYGL